jgi:hypothetical protein
LSILVTVKKIFGVITVFFLFFGLSSPEAEVRRSFSFPGGESAYGFPENDEVRKKYRSVLGSGPLLLRQTNTRVEELSGEKHRVKVTVAEQNKAVYLLFINEESYSFPLYSRGTYIIKTDDTSGEILQIKIFIKSDPGSFVRIFPDEDRSRLDLYLYGYPLYIDVLLPLPPETLTSAPFAKIITATDGVIHWDIIFPETMHSGYKTLISMVETVREALPFLPDAEDGALNGEGRFVFIETLTPMEAGGFNCSGFAKWLVDGLYLPMTGTCLDIGPLKVRNTDDRGNRWSQRYETVRDPYFGLDWTRNLAMELEKVRRGGPVDSGFADVRDVPFFSYTDDVGFPAEHLPIIIYLLAIKEPGYLYLASVNDQSTAAPNLRQHFHVAAVFPYFTASGEFKAPVFERNFESALSDFSARYPGAFVHLVRVPGLGDFTPPVVE